MVDGSFAVAISMSFTDAAAEAYQIHQKFVEQYVKPLVTRLVVYDFG